MKRTWIVVALAAGLFLLALGVAWSFGTRIARRNTERVLAQSETLFAQSVDDWVYALLLHTSFNLHRALGHTARVLPVAEMRELAARFGVDEFNVVNREGICIASSWPGLGGVGYDFRSYPETLPYLALTDGVTKVVSQPFRHGTTNPQDYSKYFGTPFKDGSGFMELGFRFERLQPSIDLHDIETVRCWKVGRTGHLTYFADHARLGLPGDLRDGAVAEGREDGVRVFCRPFSFAGHRYLSVLPEAEYFQQRNVNFAILAPSLAGVLLFLAFFVRSLARANESERRRRAAEDAARARDLALARTVQLSGVEPVSRYRRQIFSLTFDAMSRPAREVGGDFYDFFFIDPVHMAFLVADVSGKGIPAAMYMMRARNELFNALTSRSDPAEAVAEANRILSENNDAQMFVTAWVGVVDTAAGTLEYVNAGHERPLVRHASGDVARLSARGGRFLGLFPEAKYVSAVYTFEPGDTLFVYTDGVTEAMDRNRKLYGKARLEKALAGCAADAESALAAVAADVRAFAEDAEQSDDLTALALTWHGAPARAEREFAASAATDGTAMAWLREHVALQRAAKARLLNAADEMMTNIASYSGAAAFTASVEHAPRRTRLVFTDGGTAYNPLAHTDPDVHIPLADRSVGGLGILMTKRLVDSVTYRRADDRNILTLVQFDR